MNLDTTRIENWIAEDNYERVVAHLTLANHPIIDVLQEVSKGNYKRDLPSNLSIEHIQLDDVTVLKLIAVIRQNRKMAVLLRFPFFLLGGILYVAGIYGVYIAINGNPIGVVYLCGIPLSIVPLYFSLSDEKQWLLD